MFFRAQYFLIAARVFPGVCGLLCLRCVKKFLFAVCKDTLFAVCTSIFVCSV